MKKIIFIMLLLSIPSFVFASKLPEYDIKNYCKEVALASGGSSMIELGCRDMENIALTELQKIQIPEKIFNYCNEIGSVSGGSYSIFQGCVQMEQEAAKQLN